MLFAAEVKPPPPLAGGLKLNPPEKAPEGAPPTGATADVTEGKLKEKLPDGAEAGGSVDGETKENAGGAGAGVGTAAGGAAAGFGVAAGAGIA